MLIDCQTCPVRERHCDDCIVSTMLDARPGLALDDAERHALDVFLAAGLITDGEVMRVRAVTEPWAVTSAVG